MEILKIVELLHQNELLIADLYRECARLFPDFKDDFEDFVAEEEAHAGVFARISMTSPISPETGDRVKSASELSKSFSSR